MKLAFISDIHANLPALEATWNDIQKQKPDIIFCLGDLVNFAGWDNEVIEFIRNKNIPTLQGNHDEGIGYGYDTFNYSYKTEAQHQFGIASIERLRTSVTEENKRFLRSLPFSVKLVYKFPFHHITIALVHGSVFSNNDYIYPNTKDKDLLIMLDEIDADILLMGHTHKPFHKAIFCEEENRKLYRHAINVGSVGKPKHGNNKSCYTLLEIDEAISLNEPDAVRVHFKYVAYDTAKVINHIHALGLGNAYDDFLKNGES
ncbi:MAG TPA: metallophosphoesterase [Parafilimonas sp.]|nr:metallophosphoesterase [Parafilimonas sp.]